MLASNEAPCVLTSRERQTREREKVGFRVPALRHLPAQLIALGSVESQAGQGRAAQGSGEITSPALLLEPPALFEFTIGIILNVPARTKRLQGGKAIEESSGTHQRSRRPLPRWSHAQGGLLHKRQGYQRAQQHLIGHVGSLSLHLQLIQERQDPPFLV